MQQCNARSIDGGGGLALRNAIERRTRHCLGHTARASQAAADNRTEHSLWERRHELHARPGEKSAPSGTRRAAIHLSVDCGEQQSSRGRRSEEEFRLFEEAAPRQRATSAASKRLRVCAIGRHEGSVLFPLLDVPPLLSQRMRVSVLGHSRGVTSTRGARKLSLRRDRCGSRQAAAKQATRHYVSHLKGSGHGRS